MKALVTGGLGFIGSHVVDKLIASGICVYVYDLAHNLDLSRDDVVYIAGSILDLHQLSGAMSGVDVVFHLAAVADVKDVFEKPEYSEAINTRGTFNVLEAARIARVDRVVYGSTTWVYSDSDDDEVDETTPLHPPSHLYTATKVAGEYYCRSYSELFGLKTTVLRYGIPYGPRARDGAVIPIFVRKALAGEPLTIAGDGSQFRQFVFVEDLADGNVKALKSEAPHRIFNLDGSERITIRQIADTLADVLGNVKIEQVEERTGDFKGKVVSSERANRELGWSPGTTFADGLAAYVDWYRDRETKRAEHVESTSQILQNL